LAVFIKCWVNGVRPVTSAYIRLTLIQYFFFLKLLENFQGTKKLEINEVGQNDFIFEIQGTIKIPLYFTINPRCPNTKLTTTKGERKPS
jgi:hypothetical protein